MLTPTYVISDDMARYLMDIQGAAVKVALLPLPSSVMVSLRQQSKEQTVILSTKIEGNLLDEASKRAAMYGGGSAAQEQEVRNLFLALDFLEAAEQRELPITESLIKRLHAIIQVIPSGRRPQESPYRQVQNQVGSPGQSHWYLPPEPADIATLMEDLVAWANHPKTLRTPAPIVAGALMHRFLTIHPYMDGNGRTARMLATYALRRAGLGLKGIFVLETFYDRNLDGYYKALQMGLSHNFYFGRNEAAVTPWLDFFLQGLAQVYTETADVVAAHSASYMASEPQLLKDLSPLQRHVFAQLALKVSWVSTTDLRSWSGLSDRTVRDRVKRWIGSGFMVPKDATAKRIRALSLGPQYAELAAKVALTPDRYQYLLAKE